MISTHESIADVECTIAESGHEQLKALLEPRNIAIFGATNESGTVGHLLFKNLLESPFYGAIFPVNASGERVFDIHAYTNIDLVPGPVDLAVIATPLSIVPGILKDCISAGVKSAIALSPGFRETGTISQTLEGYLRAPLNSGKIRLLGPNSLGVMNPRKGLNATLTSTMARPGNIGFISQSGALCRAVLDWSFHENVGFSAVISTGSMLDVDWGDLIDYLGDDPYTQSIVIHMEALGDARAFLAAAREVAPVKPIIVLKGGCTEAAAKAAIAHTGGVGGRHEVFEAALQRCGVLRVNRISELFNMAEVLAKRRFQLRGNRLTIITNSGGLGVLATDALVSTGGQLGELTPETLAQLDDVLPSDWSHSNPIDLLGDADGDRYQQAIDSAVQDPNTDGLLVILAPQGVANPTRTAETLKDIVNRLQMTPLSHKPILASWVGGAEVLAGEAILNRYQIPTYPYLDSAARLFTLMWQHSYGLQGLYETPELADQWESGGPDRPVVHRLLQTARQEGRTTLTSAETATLLWAYGLPMVTVRLAASAGEAVAIADAMGYPVVLRHKGEGAKASPPILPEVLGEGIQWHAANAATVRQAYSALTAPPTSSNTVLLHPLMDRAGSYELMMGSAIDPQFGPVIQFGGGGWFMDGYDETPQGPLRHRAMALPPLNAALAQRLLERTFMYPVLQGKRGHPGVDLDALKTLLVRFSQLVVEQPWIQSIHINPLLMRPEMMRPEMGASRGNQPQPMAAILEARVELHRPDADPASLPQPVLRPYPRQYVQPCTLPDGTPLLLRPVRPTDESLLRAYQAASSVNGATNGDTGYPHQGDQGEYPVSPPDGQFNLYQRSDSMTRLCFLDYNRAIVIVAEYRHPTTGRPAIKGIGCLSQRASKTTGHSIGQIDLSVDNDSSDRGLDRLLLQQLMHMGRQEGLHTLVVNVLNHPALSALCQQAGFDINPSNPSRLEFHV